MPSFLSWLAPTVGGALLAPSVVVLLAAGPRGPSPEQADRLAMAAQASGRPKECKGASPSGKSRLTIWDRARQPHLARYCDLLGRAHAKLIDKPSAAREAALLADQVLPGQAAPWVTIGRAHVRLRDYARAVQDFEKARKLDPRSIEDPSSLHDLAIAQRKTGKLQEAMTTYRVLVPRLGLLPSSSDRIEVFIEAASLSTTRGNDGLDEALALLAEARSQPLSSHNAVVLALLALTFDRAGKTQEANAALDAIHRASLSRQLAAQESSASQLLTHTHEWSAMLALVLEAEDPPRALASWQKYLEAKPQPPFADHAKRRHDALKRAPARFRR